MRPAKSWINAAGAIWVASALLLGLTVLSGSLYFKSLYPAGDHVNTVTELIVSPFGYPHPFKLNFVAQYRFVHQAGEFLIRRDNHQNIVGGLAHSWTISADRRQITFHLRPHLYTADEVVQSLKHLIRIGQTSHSNLAAQTSEDRIQVMDSLNFTIHTRGDAAAVLSPLVMADAVVLPDDHWIQVPGFSEPQVDWSKTKGPYIVESGRFPLGEAQEIVLKPNPNHYFYDPAQLKWRLIYHPLDKIADQHELQQLLESTPSYATVRYWDLIKVFSTPDPGLLFYETRPNGIVFIMPNPRSKVFSDERARVAYLRRILNSPMPLLDPKNRAKQIAQPGLSGRMSESDLALTLKKIERSPDYEFKTPLRWCVPNGPGDNQPWVRQIAELAQLPYELKAGSSNPFDPRWLAGEYDLMLSSVGMSDTDPVSGATFLFSPKAANLDFPDGRILKLLNSAKDTADRELISKTVREAFKQALEGGLVMPLSYAVNRHYYSSKVALHVQDPFSESVRIWEVRLKN